MTETLRRRKKQLEYNTKNGITPTSIAKEIREGIESIKKAREIALETSGLSDEKADIFQVLSDLESEMEEAAKNLNLERSIHLRDEIKKIQNKF